MNEPPKAGLRLIAFFVQLPHPVPIPDGTTHTWVESRPISDLPGKVLSPMGGAGKFPPELQGRFFSSLKFWQVIDDEPHRGVDRHYEPMYSVLSTVTGRDYERKAEGDERRKEIWQTVASRDYYTTIVEMVRPAFVEVTEYGTVEAGNALDTCFEDCIAHLFNVVRAYRVSEQVRMPELTYEALDPTVRFVAFDPYSPNSDSATYPQFFMLRSVPRIVPPPAFMDEGRSELMNFFLEGITQGNSFHIFMERSLQARVEFERSGDFAAAVVQAGLACEVLLDAVLSYALWEEGLNQDGGGIEDAVRVLSMPLASRLRREYHPRLKGIWSEAEDGPIKQYFNEVAYVRGRVVHRGYRPERAEALVALEAVVVLAEFIKQRLAERVSLYKRTAFLALGQSGLERRGAWRKVEEFFLEEANKEQNWVDAHNEWREKVDGAIRQQATKARPRG